MAGYVWVLEEVKYFFASNQRGNTELFVTAKSVKTKQAKASVILLYENCHGNAANVYHSEKDQS